MPRSSTCSARRASTCSGCRCARARSTTTSRPRAGRVQTCVQPGLPLPIPVLPAAWAEAPGWSVVAVAGEVHDDWADVIPPDAHVAVAWQGFLRDLRAGERVRQRPPRPSPILVRADLVGVSRHDVAPRGAPRGAGVAAPARGGPAHHPGRRRRAADPAWPGWPGRHPALPLPGQRRRSRSDRGRGHVPRRAPRLRVTAGAPAMARRTRRPSTREAIRDRLDLRFAAAAGSLVVEDWGLDGVATLPVVTARLDRDRAPGRGRVASAADEATEFWPEGTTGRLRPRAPTSGSAAGT